MFVSKHEQSAELKIMIVIKVFIATKLQSPALFQFLYVRRIVYKCLSVWTQNNLSFGCMFSFFKFFIVVLCNFITISCSDELLVLCVLQFPDYKKLLMQHTKTLINTSTFVQTVYFRWSETGTNAIQFQFHFFLSLSCSLPLFILSFSLYISQSVVRPAWTQCLKSILPV